MWVKGGVNKMSDECIKDIIITLINNRLFYLGDDNEGTAKEVAKFIKTLKRELKDNGPLGEMLSPEEIAKKVGIDSP